MICVCIGRSRHKHVLAEHAHLVEQGAELVELRLDYIAGPVNLKRLIDNRPGPVVISCRRSADGGKWTGTEEQRQVLLRSAIATGVEYVDLEEDVAASIPRYGKTRRIVSLHNFQQTPDDLPAIHRRLATLDTDIVKLATMANNPHDNVRMLQLIADSPVPTVGLCMGEIGTPSRILAAKFGAPFTYATFHHERTLAPGQLSFRQMRDIHRYDNISADTAVFGVIADPIGHSLSPVIHNAAFGELKLNAVYVPFRIPRQDLDQFLTDCSQLGVQGLSVTIPHKEAVVPFCTKIDRAVKGIGAANTLVLRDGDIIGYNTDYQAAMSSLSHAMELPDVEQPLRGQTALILGAGGVAKAIALGLRKRGAKVTVVARSPDKAKVFAKEMGCQVLPWDERYMVNARIIVNCTPVGMHPNVDETPFDARTIRRSHVVFDTVYNPEQTLLIKQARQAGATVITGVDMFIRQAALQFYHFTGKPAPTALMRDVLKRTIGPVKI